ncbi:hypothetical protein [Litoribaculum gwangyangense]
MKFSKFKFIRFLLLFLLGNSIFSQSEIKKEVQTNGADSSYVSLSLGYINDAVFFGRKDSISAPYLYPSITYFNKSGFYATGSFSYLTKSNESRIDLFLGTIGYDFNIRKLQGDISFTKYFFNTDSYNVISEVEADISAIMVYDLDILNVGVGATLFINKNSGSDFFLYSEISHDFVTKHQRFQISPTAGIYFGSQNFYEEYYINNRFGNGSRGKGSGQGNVGNTQTAVTSVVLEESEKFSLMAIEFSLPIWYVNKPYILGLSPYFIIPKTPATLTTETDIYKEDLDNTFYFMLSISYIF